MAIVVNMLAVALTCAVIGITADLFRKAGISLYTEQYLALLLALAMPLIYLHVPAKDGRQGRKGAGALVRPRRGGSLVRRNGLRGVAFPGVVRAGLASGRGRD